MPWRGFTKSTITCRQNRTGEVEKAIILSEKEHKISTSEKGREKS